MDTALLSLMQTGGRNKAQVDMMVNMEARKLVSTANAIATSHLHDGIARVQFMDDIRNEFDITKKANAACCLSNRLYGIQFSTRYFIP